MEQIATSHWGPAGTFSYDSRPVKELLQNAIDNTWAALPANVKKFILHSTPDGRFHLAKLIEFWSLPQNIGMTHHTVSVGMYRTTWDLALMYMKLHMDREARALTINGAFFHQCSKTSLEYIKSFCEPGAGIPHKQPYLISAAQEALQSPYMMEVHIRSHLPKERTKTHTSFASLTSKTNVMDYVDGISGDWNASFSASRNGRHRSSFDGDKTQILLILVDYENEDERHEFNITSSTTLKALFNDYADKRGISLRSLRFSYGGETLFLSSAGRQTPEELGMQDQDEIVVVKTSKPRESTNNDSSGEQTATAKKINARKRSKKKDKGKCDKKPQQREEPTTTLEECKVQHSKQLTKIHEEAQAQFRQIRQRLCNLAIERNQPKIKSKRSRTPKDEPFLPSMANNFKEGIGGKAGKAGKCRYEIQVGEVQNLYKTTKPSAMAPRSSLSSTLPTLDLHGCTREEALVKLDESLEVWVDSAMKASYPFVQRAVIVCGCGNQILSETVQRWIRSNDKVSNAPKPKVRSSKR